MDIKKLTEELRNLLEDNDKWQIDVYPCNANLFNVVFKVSKNDKVQTNFHDKIEDFKKLSDEDIIKIIEKQFDFELNDVKVVRHKEFFKDEDLNENLNEQDIKKLVDTIEAELDYRGFRNMGLEVDESAFEPSVTLFINWNDEFTSKQSDLIREKFDLFKTTEYVCGAEIYTQSDVRSSDSSIEFVAVVNAETEITDEVANEIAEAFVQQLTNFWDEVYSEEMLNDRFEENLNENDDLDIEQQEELKKAIELYRKHGMLFLDDEEGQNAYDVLYNAGYTMKKDGDVAHCIELNRVSVTTSEKLNEDLPTEERYEFRIDKLNDNGDFRLTSGSEYVSDIYVPEGDTLKDNIRDYIDCEFIYDLDDSENIDYTELSSFKYDETTGEGSFVATVFWED